MVEYRIEIPEQLHHQLQARRRDTDVARVCVEALSRSTAAERARPIVDDLIRMFNPHRPGTWP